MFRRTEFSNFRGLLISDQASLPICLQACWQTMYARRQPCRAPRAARTLSVVADAARSGGEFSPEVVGVPDPKCRHFA
jgi:hypothetical protein